jgi:hypothetical protein
MGARVERNTQLRRVAAIPGMNEAKLRAVVRCGHEAAFAPRR